MHISVVRVSAKNDSCIIYYYLLYNIHKYISTEIGSSKNEDCDINLINSRHLHLYISIKNIMT